VDSGAGYDRAPFTSEFYDHIIPYGTAETCPSTLMRHRSAGGVLELGRGTGRLLIPTERAGVEITGLDASEAMLQVCRERLRAEPPPVQARVGLHRGDMHAFDFGYTFLLVTIPFRPLRPNTSGRKGL
jgi:SAM-dependent methyltransferase